MKKKLLEKLDRIRRDKGENPSAFKELWEAVGDRQLEVDRLRQQNRALVGTLEWYANVKNYDDEGRPGEEGHEQSLPTNGGEEWWWEEDYGNRARLVLEKFQKGIQ